MTVDETLAAIKENISTPVALQAMASSLLEMRAEFHGFQAQAATDILNLRVQLNTIREMIEESRMH